MIEKMVRNVSYRQMSTKYFVKTNLSTIFFVDKF